MKNHKLRRILVLVACAVAVAAASVSATVAYLTSTASVKNTFTIGKVSITLDEAKTDASGVAVTPETRISGTRSASEQYTNTYQLVPGRTYVKDPTVHVQTNSEDSWVFVKVENGIEAYEAASADNYTSMADQMTANGWTPLTGVDNVYYQAYTKQEAEKDFVVFSSFRVSDEAEAVDGWSAISTANTRVIVTAYAIQKDGFANALDAWVAGGWN